MIYAIKEVNNCKNKTADPNKFKKKRVSDFAGFSTSFKVQLFYLLV